METWVKLLIVVLLFIFLYEYGCKLPILNLFCVMIKGLSNMLGIFSSITGGIGKII
jgi:hypothetical protein